MTQSDKAITIIRCALEKALPEATNWWTTKSLGDDYTVGMRLDGEHYDVYLMSEVKLVKRALKDHAVIPLELATERDPWDEAPFPINVRVTVLEYMLEEVI
jgi:hypothetical protein